MQILIFTCHSVFNLSFAQMNISELNKLEISTALNSTQCCVFSFNIYLSYHFCQVILIQQRRLPISKRLKQRSFISRHTMGWKWRSLSSRPVTELVTYYYQLSSLYKLQLSFLSRICFNKFLYFFHPQFILVHYQLHESVTLIS